MKVIWIAAATLAMTGLASSDVKTLWLSDKIVARVGISPKGTILSFPVKPEKAILGRQGSFGIEQTENDIAITALSSAAHSHLYVYLEGRRFSFDLSLSQGSGYGIVLIRDESEKSIQKDIQWKTKPKFK